jgi:hypothetical protein
MAKSKRRADFWDGVFACWIGRAIERYGSGAFEWPPWALLVFLAVLILWVVLRDEYRLCREKPSDSP